MTELVCPSQFKEEARHRSPVPSGSRWPTWWGGLSHPKAVRSTDSTRRGGHQRSLHLVPAVLFAMSVLGFPQASLAGFGNVVATYDVKWSNPSPATGSYIKWTMSFGAPGAGDLPPMLVETDVPPGVTGCCLLEGGINFDEVQFFLSDTDPRCCVDFANFDLFDRPFVPGLGVVFSFSAVSFIAPVASPGDFENTFTFTDPPGGTLPLPFEFKGTLIDSTGTATPFLDFSLLFHPDLTSELLSSQGVEITRTFGTSPPSPVPEPSTVLLLSAGLAGLAARTWRGKRTGAKARVDGLDASAGRSPG